MLRVKRILEDLYVKIKSELESYRCMLLPVCILAFIYLVGISAILRANFYYIDDMRRAVEGVKEWDNFSRFLSYHLSTFIHFGNHLTDISPLPQFMAVGILAVSGIIVLHVVTGKTKFTVWEYIAVVPMGLSPYFLECISYKYDSPYMAISIFGAVMPLLFLKYGYVMYVIMAFAGTLMVCTSYQAATGIFPMFVIYMVLKRWNDKEEIKDIVIFIGTSVLGYVSGMLFYRNVIMVPFDTYVSSELPALERLIPVTWKHLQTYFAYIDSDFRVEWKILILAVCITFFFVGIRDTKQKKYFAVPVMILAFVAMLMLSFGIYPMLLAPLFDPRTMYGFGVFIALIAVLVANAKKAYFGKFACIVLSYAFFVFSFTYGNALYVQKTYTDFRITETIDDLKNLEMFRTDETKTVQIIGSIGRAPALRSLPQDYQMLNRLVPVTFGDSSWGWGRYGFQNYYGIKNIVFDETVDLTTHDLPILVDNMYQTIYGADNYILIKVKP
ncbi:MAG: glucosyltransferase domain-containing protein [Lachnospiraceae bacterium]|nr:glucosyltransferase domain-containing protein [Lachnospiraceae bacterium]